MESKIYKLAALLTVAVAVVGCNFHGRCGQKPGIISEDIKGSGDTWDADFKALVPAPDKDVFSAMEKIENAKSEQILNIKVLSSQGNTKMVEIDYANPIGGSVATRFAFESFPDQKRITFKSLNGDIFQADGNCSVQAQCAATMMECRQTIKLLQERPLIDAVIKQNIRQVFAAQLDNIHRALHVEIPDQSDQGDEP